MRPVIRGLVLMCLAMLAACGGEPAPSGNTRISLVTPPDGPMQCVPYARSVSGIDIRGDAWTWWPGAEGRYQRGPLPRPGAVLVFKRTNRLPRGHVAVVARVVNRREILVTHANWGSTAATRGKIARDVPVIDVSPENNWSEVRVWNGNGAFGKVYPAHGFIYPSPYGPAEISELPICVRQ